MNVPAEETNTAQPRDWPSYKIIDGLHDYQKYAHDFIMDHPFCGLFLDMGMGKTVTTLSALYDLNPACHVLVIAPLNIARSTWMDEIEKWNLPFRTRSLIVNERGKKYTKKKRLEVYKEIFDSEPTLWFINRELLCDLIDNLPKKDGRPVWPFPMVVIDEAQSFKNPSSNRFRALRSVRPQILRMVQLTGTPAPNGLLDIWAQIYLLDQGQRLGTSMTRYKDAFFRSTFMINGVPMGWVLKYGADDVIYDRINDIVISMKNTRLKLPPVTYDYDYVHLDDDETALYNAMKKDFVLQVNENGELAAYSDEDDDAQPHAATADIAVAAANDPDASATGDVIAKNAAVLSAKLSQMASGALYTDSAGNYSVVHERKLDYVEYILRNTATPVMVAYHFKSDLDMLEKRLHARKLDYRVFDGSPEMVHAWNRSEIPIMLLQPASAGHGLNLQEGDGHTLIWYTIPWSLEEYLQCNARLYRQGQKNPVVIHHILCADTIDEHIKDAIEHKDMSQRKLLASVRAELEKKEQTKRSARRRASTF